MPKRHERVLMLSSSVALLARQTDADEQTLERDEKILPPECA